MSYQGENLVALRNRYSYLIKLKEENSKHFWKLYNEAKRFLVGRSLAPETEPAEDEEKQEAETAAQEQADPDFVEEDQADTTDNNDFVQPGRMSTTRRSSRSTSSAPAAAATGNAEGEDANRTPPPPRPPARTARTAARTPPRTTARTPPRMMSPVPGTLPGQTVPQEDHPNVMFETWEDVADFCQDVFEVDFDRPEFAGLFGLHILKNPNAIVVTASATHATVSDEIKISLHSLVDPSDFYATKVQLVMGGQGFIFTRPLVPGYYKHSYNEMFADDYMSRGVEVSNEDAKTYMMWMSDYMRAPNRKYGSIGFRFPAGMTVTNDMTSPEPKAPKEETLVIKTMSKLALSADIVDEDGEEEFNDVKFMALPAYWRLRVVGSSIKHIGLEQKRIKKKKESFMQAFGGK